MTERPAELSLLRRMVEVVTVDYMQVMCALMGVVE